MALHAQWPLYVENPYRGVANPYMPGKYWSCMILVLIKLLLTPYPLLITTIVVFNLFYSSIKSLLLRTKCVFKHKDLQMIGFKFKN